MFIVIMAGGSGTRFWPLSRKYKPKQFLNIIGNDPMIIETYKRISSLTDDKNICIILGKEHFEEAKKLFCKNAIHIIAEPYGRNTAPCIALGALYASYLGHKGAIAFLPADHYIANNEIFLNSLRVAGKVATSSKCIVTLGIVPIRPETGYGYIKIDGISTKIDGYKVYKVQEFVEKPDIDTAQIYLQSKKYYWNSGIFIARPSTILEEIKRYIPKLYKAIMGLKDYFNTKQFEFMLREAYKEIPNISFDYGVMEKTDTDIYVLPTECGWSDVGSWLSIYYLRKKEQDINSNLIDGDVINIDCKNSFINARGNRFIACIGLNRLLIVDTPDALLVADINRSQDVRNIVDLLKKRGKTEYI